MSYICMKTSKNNLKILLKYIKYVQDMLREPQQGSMNMAKGTESMEEQQQFKDHIHAMMQLQENNTCNLRTDPCS